MEALRERHADGRPARPVETPTQAEPHATPGGGWLVCAHCRALIAEGRARIEVDGAFAHSFINPEGAIFRVGCFAVAPGVVPWGEPSKHWTWFAGFEWRAAVCRGCASHLGWVYTAETASFVALILDRLVEIPAGPDAT